MTSLARVAVFFDGVSADGASVAGLALSTGSGLGGVLIIGVSSAVSPLVLGCNLLVGFVVGAAKDKDKFNETIATVNADRVSTRDSGCRGWLTG